MSGRTRGPAAAPPLSGDPARDRIREATIDLVLERGYEEASLEDLLERAAVERADFGQRFDGLQDCVLGAYWEYTDEFSARLREAFEREAAWRDGLRAAAYTAARYIRDNPRIVRFGTVALMQAGPMAQAERESHLHRMVDMIDAGRGTRSAVDFVPELMYVAVRPYVGEEVAREELAIPPPPESGLHRGGKGGAS